MSDPFDLALARRRREVLEGLRLALECGQTERARVALLHLRRIDAECLGALGRSREALRRERDDLAARLAAAESELAGVYAAVDAVAREEHRLRCDLEPLGFGLNRLRAWLGEGGWR